MKHALRGVLLSSAVALTAGAAHAQDNPVTIGGLIPLTGGLQAYGEATLTGIRLAVQQANEAGGVLGREVELVTGDTQTRAQAAIDAAKRLTSVENVAGLLGPMSSGNFIPVVTSVAAVEGTPILSNSATAPTITDLDDEGYAFRTTPSDAGQGLVLGELARAQGLENVAIVYVNNDYGQGLAEAFTASFEDAGGSVTGSAAFEPNQASYRGELQNLANSGDPDALLVIAYPDDGGLLIVRQALEEGFFEEFVFTDGMKVQTLGEQFGQFVEGTLGTAPRATESDASQRFAEAYEAEFGELPPLPYIDTAYDATTLLLLAIQQAGSTDGAAVRDALTAVATPPGETILPGEFEKALEMIQAGTEINYEGASGAVDFDEAGDVSGTFEHWTIENGALKTVEIIQ